MHRARRLRPLLSIFLFSITSSTATGQTLRDPRLIAEPVVTGLAEPTQLVFLGPDDFLVSEQKTGLVKRVTGGAVAGSIVDLAVNRYGGHTGLMGMTVHPQFASNGIVYLMYSESSTGSDTSVQTEILGQRVYRFTFDGATLHSPLLIVDAGANPGAFHNGGILEFGPDGKLYFVMGDQERLGQLQNVDTGPAPNLTSCILRLDDDGSPAAGNPLAATAGWEPYYAYGVRNSYGLDFDPVTGLLWETENGPTTMDEINVVEPGFNSGWRDLMGPDARDPQGIADLVLVPGALYSDPEFSWLQTVGVTAIEFLESTALGSSYENDAFVADVNNGNIYHFELNPGRTAFAFSHPGLADQVADDAGELDELIWGTGFSQATDLDTGPDENLYVLGRLGTVYRIRSKFADLMTSDLELVTACATDGEVCVSGSYSAYGTGLPLASVQVDFYLDTVQPGSLLASYTDTNVGDGDLRSHDFCFSWPDSFEHDVLMVVDAMDEHAEDVENNNVAVQHEDCREYLVAAPPALSQGYALRPNFPNPFNPSTRLSFVLPGPTAVQLRVFDVRGRLVATLVDALLPPGEHDVDWRATDPRGRATAAGVYMVRLESDYGVLSRPVVLLE